MGNLNSQVNLVHRSVLHRDVAEMLWGLIACLDVMHPVQDSQYALSSGERIEVILMGLYGPTAPGR